ncbi:Tetratricopeptide-like helical [Artemisia annua]|uniref:Tetratricopeptide-like helical n=1 Tax=Artemisia annua TaxID=35608 RepID=A0A2U1PFZ7_ARTAN|nr:Tetratricopeptide-like helical [Artemisia annua]
MSPSGTPESDLGFHKPSFSDHLRHSLLDNGDDTNKPDFRELDLGQSPNLKKIPVRVMGRGSGSPISPLRAQPAASSGSSSSGSVSGQTGNRAQVHSGSGRVQNNHSREMSVDSPATSSPVNVLPAGNICGSGRVLRTGMMVNRSSKPDVLSLGSGNYGHGSIMSVNNSKSKKLTLSDGQDLNKLGNEEYKKGHFLEAISYYDKAIAISPVTAAYHCNRAAALICMKRLSEAVKGCEEAIRLDSCYVRAHHRLGSILISLGQVESARKHLYFPGYQPDPKEVQKLQVVEKRLSKCTDSRRVRDWSGVLRESEAAILSGADACPQLFACKAEALLKLHKLDDADLILLNVPKFEASSSPSCSQVKFFGMLSEAYLLFVRAQIDMTLGRFENAVASVEKSGQIDPRNVEVAVLLQNVRSLTRARTRGNDLFKSERFTEACSAYGEGLRFDPSNPIIYCNRAACWFKLGQFERSLDDCNQALLFHPNYTKALLRRATTYSKLERWAESVKDYEVLRRELPDNNDIAESLFHAQVALKKSLGEAVYNMKFGGEVETITGLEQFKAAVASTGASVVLFKRMSDLQCKQISSFLDTLCTRHPSINFLVVDTEESPAVANVENVKTVPTIKIYKKGNQMKEMLCPCREVLESSVRHYIY